jgi:predicted metal-dependent phosphoesterase TrpH
MEFTHPIIDLHMHSAVSDGTDTPEELLSHVRKAGIRVFSLTDHDAISGCRQVHALLKPGDPHFLFGVEFSCKDAYGKYHILGYGYDPDAASICGVVNAGHMNRLKKLDLRLDRLRTEFGIAFPHADADMLHALPNPGKPHLAKLMVRYGYSETISAAFHTVLNRLHVPDLYTSPVDAIRGIRDAGGVPVLAHPCFGDGDQLILGDALEKRILRLKDAGLLGLEGFYSGFTETLRAQVLAFAEAFELYVTAGGDFHGGNKLIPLADTGLLPDTPFPDGLQRFLRDMHCL